MSDTVNRSVGGMRYTTSSVLNTLPDTEITNKLSPTIRQLSNAGLSRSPSPAITNIPTAAAPTPVESLRDVLSVQHAAPKASDGKKATTIIKAAGISADTDLGNRLKADFQVRIGALTQQEKIALDKLLHYPTVIGGPSTNARLVNRAVLVAAFAQGASFQDLAGLRAHLDKAGDSMRTAIHTCVTTAAMHPSDLVSALDNRAQINPGDLDKENAVTRIMEQGGAKGYIPLLRDSMAAKLRAAKADPYGDGNKLGIPGPILGAMDEERQNLYREGMMAVGFYCTNASGRINTELRDSAANGRPVDSDVAGMTRLATEAMKILPDYKGIVVRGETDGPWIENYKVGTTVTNHGFTSSSADLGFRDKNVIFVIESHHGKSVADLSVNAGALSKDGVEVLFPPNTQFEVLEHQKAADGKTYIVMREARRADEI